MMRSKFAAFVVAVLSVFLHAVPAGAVTPIIAVPGSYMTTYASVVAVTTVGADLAFINADIQFHDVVSEAFGPDDQPWCQPDDRGNRPYPLGECPLLWSDQVALGASTPVLGTENLEAGETYAFYCQPHTWMRGTLIVAG